MFDLFLKWISKGEKPVFVSNKQEFLSIWSIAHAWEGLNPESTDEHDIPESIQAHMDMLMLAYLREEMTVRQRNGYRLLQGHTLLQALLGLDKGYMRLSDQLFRKNPINRQFLDGLYVRRSHVLHWCEKEFREPPARWMPTAEATQVDERPAEDGEDTDTWYGKLSQQRKDRVVCLEVAKHLWAQNQGLLYEQVRPHPVMKRLSHRQWPASNLHRPIFAQTAQQHSAVSSFEVYSTSANRLWRVSHPRLVAGRRRTNLNHRKHDIRNVDDCSLGHTCH